MHFNMFERDLSYISLIFSLVGVFLILFLSENLEPKFYQIFEIDNSLIDKIISTSGKINLVKETEQISLFILENNSSKILVFTENNKKLNLKKDTFVKVIGKILMYNGELEIEIKEIKRL